MGCCCNKKAEADEPLAPARKQPAPSADIIQKKIAQAKKTGVLALRECSLKTLPPAAADADAASIRAVDLSGNTLKRLPDSIGVWVGLESLSCGQNSLSELPSAVSQLVSLKKLDLSRNKLSEFPSQLLQLGKLRLLQLNGNQMGPMLSVADFGTELPKALEELDIADNGLTELPTSLGGLRSLVRLVIARNRIKELPDSLGGLAKLQHLDAAENQLSSVPRALLEGTVLSDLSLKGNPIDRLQLQETPGFSAFLERRKSRIDNRIEAQVVGAIDLNVCGLD